MKRVFVIRPFGQKTDGSNALSPSFVKDARMKLGDWPGADLAALQLAMIDQTRLKRGAFDGTLGTRAAADRTDGPVARRYRRAIRSCPRGFPRQRDPNALARGGTATSSYDVLPQEVQVQLDRSVSIVKVGA